MPDHRDFKYIPGGIETDLPPSIDLRADFPQIYDQGHLRSCTANAIAAAFQFELIKQRLPLFMPSRLFIYYNARVLEGTVQTDAGAYLRDGMNRVSLQGVCSEDAWEYNVSEFAQKPFESCYNDAKGNVITSYFSVDQDLDKMRSCLAEGYPFVFGFTIYDSFESLEVCQTGILNLPGDQESVLGGHAVVAVGYDDSRGRFIVRNSYGEKWGTNGYFTMPYEYLLNNDLSDDFWTIRLVNNQGQSQTQGRQGSQAA
jgi:C1A family cysteine protease